MNYLNYEKIKVRDLQGNEFDITGPPEYIRRIATDQNFADKEIQVQSDKRFAFNLINEEDIDCQLNQSCSQLSQDSTIDFQNLQDSEIDDLTESSNENYLKCGQWFDAPTKLLIALYTEYYKKVGTTFKLKTKKKMWELIQKKMCDNGYNFTVIQIENKWKGLERKFKKKTENNKKTGRNRQTCPYEKELEECMSEKPTVFPEHLLNSDDDEGKTRKEMMEAAGISQNIVEKNTIETMEQSTDNDSQSNTENDLNLGNRKKRLTVAKELKEYRHSREKLHEENMTIKEKKLEAYKERTREIKKRNGLLEELIKKIG